MVNDDGQERTLEKKTGFGGESCPDRQTHYPKSVFLF